MGKKKQTQTQTTHQVVTPTNPAWVDSGIQDVMGKVTDLGKLDPSSLIAGLSHGQQTAIGRANTAGIDPEWFNKTMNADAPQVQSASLLEGLDGYMNPFLQKVVDTSLGDFDQNAGATRAQQTLDIARQGAFGGSGAALTRSMTEDSLARARGSLDAGLRSEAFTTGANLSSQDAARRQQASEANASLTMQQRAQQAGLMFDKAADDRANTGLIGDLGNIEREVNQAKLGAPVSMAQTQAGLIGSLPLNLLHGETRDGTDTTTSTSSGGTLGTLASLAMLAAAPFTGGATLLGTLGMGAGTAAALGTAGKLAMTANAAKGLMRG